MGLNNELNRRLNKEYPRDFSVKDVDLDSWCYYKITGNLTMFQRRILGEVKNKNEGFTGTQLPSAQAFNKIFDWSKYDSHSGFYVFRDASSDDPLDQEKNFDKIDVSHISAPTKVIRTMLLDELYEWLSCKDKGHNPQKWVRKSDGQQILSSYEKDRQAVIDDHKAKVEAQQIGTFVPNDPEDTRPEHAKRLNFPTLEEWKENRTVKFPNFRKDFYKDLADGKIDSTGKLINKG